MKSYSRVNEIPKGQANDTFQKGCLVLEGGAWRGIYSEGAIDALLEQNINLDTTIGVSAGALNSMNYVSGQIGRASRFNLTYRHDSNYCGLKAMKRDHGITGFSFLNEELEKIEPLNRKRFDLEQLRLIVTATDCEDGSQKYFEKGQCDIDLAVQASATVPYVSEPVEIDGHRYLDGGIACKIPFDWAIQQGFEKIVVIRTRDSAYRKTIKRPLAVNHLAYEKKYPAIMRLLQEEGPMYNLLLSRLAAYEQQGRIFVLAPKEPVDIRRFEGDMEKLGDLYWRGYNETKEQIPSLLEYLAK